MTKIRMNITVEDAQTLKNVLRLVNTDGNSLALTEQEREFVSHFEDRLYETLTLKATRAYVKDSLAQKYNPPS